MNFVHLNGALHHYKFVPAAPGANTDNNFVFINSLGTDFRIWDELAEILRTEGNLLLFDKRGHGLSGLTIKSGGLESYAKDVGGLMKHLSIDKAVVVGVSVGGMIAQLVAHLFPEKVEKLVLCDTRHKIGNSDIWNERIMEVKRFGLKRISDDVMHRWFTERFWEENSSMVLGCQLMIERTSVQGYIQACEGLRDADLTSVAKKLKLPTLCVVGSDDKSTPPKYVRDLADLVEGSKFAILPGSGHMPCMDNPVALGRLIKEFINGRYSAN